MNTVATQSILIVDDTPANLAVVVAALEHHGYRIFVAQDGEEGLQRADLVRPDLILLDVMMPGLDGIEVCRRLKAKLATRDIPVLFMTALSGVADKVAGFGAGGVDYITKPFQLDEVLARVATHLKLHAMQRQLERQNAELREYREHLEQLVAVRTAEVREANERLKLKSFALSRVREAAYLIDANDRLLYVNDEACRALGYGADELMALTVSDIDPDWTPAMTAQSWPRLRSEGVLNLEATHRRKDGSRFPVEITASYFEYGNRAYNLALARDITERKEAERKLVLLNHAVDHSHDATYLVDDRLRLRYVNEAACRVLGYSREELLSRELLDIDPDVTHEAVLEMMRQTAAAGTFPGTIETRHRTKDGRIFPVEIGASSFEYDGETLFLTVARDITARRQADLELRASERKFRTLTENIPDNIVRYDGNARVVYVNPTLERTLGDAAAAMLGATVRERHPDGSYEDYAALVDAVLAGGAGGELEKILPGPPGQPPQVHLIRMVPERDENGDVVGVLALGRDITERQRMEAELRRQADFQQTLLNGLNDVGMQMMIIENGRVVHYSNRKRAQDFGLADADIDAHPALLDFIHPDDRARVADLHRRRLAGEAVPSSYELALLSRGGERRDYEMSVAVVPNTEPVRVIAIAKDISERKRAERERQEHLRLLEGMDRINRAIRQADDIEQMMGAVLDIVLSIFDCDRAYLLYPCDPEAATWSVPFERTRPEFPGALASDMAVAMTEDVARTLHILLAADGPVTFGPGTEHELPADASERFGFRCFMSMALHPKVGKPWQFGIHQCSRARAWTADEQRLLQEIGQRLTDGLTGLLAFRDLQSSEWKFRTLVENIPDLIVRYDLDLRRTYVNPAWVELSGLHAEQVVNVPAAAIPNVPQPAVGAYMAKIRAALENGTRQESEFTWVNARGCALNLSYVVVPEFDRNGDIAGALAVGRDITQLRQAERRLRESYDLLQELTARGETAREEERKRIAREIHDELGQHLTALRMGVSTLRFQFGRDNPVLAQRIQDMMALADKTLQVVRHVAAALRPAVLDMGLGSALEWLAGEFERHGGVPCRVELGDADHRYLDEERAMALFRIVQESLTNVARHAQADWVRISVARKGDACIVEVCDGGRGFDPAAPRGKSFGLVGMRERALMLGGEISVDSRPGDGTKVRVVMPILEPRETS